MKKASLTDRLIYWVLWLVLVATLVVGFMNGAFAQQTHPCQSVYCKPGKFLGLTVSGTVSASSFIGDGSQLTGISGGGGGGGSPSAPLGSVQFNSATDFGGTPNFTVSSITPTVVRVSGTVSVTTLLPGTISGTGASSLTALYANTGLFGGPTGSGTSVIEVRQICVGSSSCGIELRNPSAQSKANLVLDATGSAANLIISRGGFSNQMVIGQSGRIGINKSPNSTLDVAGTVSATGGLFQGNVTVQGLTATAMVTATNINASGGISASSLEVFGSISGTVTHYVTQTTIVNQISTTNGPIDELIISQTASGVVSITTASATTWVLSLTSNTQANLVGGPLSSYMRGINIHTIQAGSGSNTFVINGCKWSGGYTPSPTLALGSQDDWFATTVDQGSTWHCYLNGSGMQ